MSVQDDIQEIKRQIADLNRRMIGTRGDVVNQNFDALTDTPANKTGSSLMAVRCNSAENALEYWAFDDSSKYIDNFADAARHWSWVDTARNGTISEAAGVLTLAIANGINGNWWGADENAPTAMMGLRGYLCEAIIKINSFTVNDQVGAGFYITDSVAGTNGIFYRRMRDDGAGRNGLQVVDVNVGSLNYVAVATLPIWLRIRVIGSGTGARHLFAYSTDGLTYTAQYTLSNESVFMIGVFAINWGGFNAISAPFEFFSMGESGGPG